MQRLLKAAALAALLGAVGAPTSGCGGGWSGSTWQPWPGVLVYAVTDSGTLISFRSVDPDLLLTSAVISGLEPGESILAIDVRPATGVLYGLGDSARLYTLVAASGIATAVSPAPFAPLVGTKVGIDFDAVADSLRLVSDADENMRIDPDTGLLAAADAALAYEPTDPAAGFNPGIVALAHTRSFAGATATTAFALDTDRDALVRLGGLDGAPSPDGGLLFTVGWLGLNAVGPAGLDVIEVEGVDRAYAAVATPGSASSLFLRITLATGEPTYLGVIGSSDLVLSIAVAP